MPSTITEELRVLVSAEVARAVEQLGQFDKTLEKNEKQTKKLSDALDKMQGKALLMSGAFIGAGVASIKFAGELEKTQKSLEVLLKDAEKATKIKDEWTALAAETPFQTEDIDNAGKKLLAFGVGADVVTKTLRQIGDVSAATGSSVSELADLYGKAKVQGRLFAQDINQFQGRGIPIVQELAKQLGTSESNIKGMVEQGKIGFAQIQKAFESMTSPGGQFAGMMEELSKTTLGKFSTAADNAKLAMAGFGQVLLPITNDMLDAATKVFASIQEMDDGTKRFIVTFGGIVALSGPVIFAINGMNAALVALAANPAFLVIGGSVLALGLAAGAISKYNNQLADSIKNIEKQSKSAQTILSTYEQFNTSKTLDKKTTEELIRIYPQLAGKIGSYKTSIEEARVAVENLTKEQVKNTVAGQQNHLQRMLNSLENERKQYNDINEEFQKIQHLFLSGKATDTQYLNIQQLRDNLKKSIESTESQYKESLKKLNETVQSTGYTLSENLQLEPIVIPVTLNTAELTPPPEAQKTWQAWFEEITGVAQKDFGESGLKAGKLYIDNLEISLKNADSVASILGEKLDMSGVLKGQQEQIQKDLAELFSKPGKNIDGAFSGTDSSVTVLVEKFKALGTQIKNLDYADSVKNLQEQIDALALSESALALSVQKAKGYTTEQAQAIVTLNNEFERAQIIKEYEGRVSDLGKSQIELARQTLVAKGATEEQLASFDEAAKKMADFNKPLAESSLSALFANEIGKMLETLTEFDESAITVFSNIGGNLLESFAMFPFDALESIGGAFAEGADAGEAFSDAIASSALQILNNLPNLFLQAGLQLIGTPGMWPIGLGLIAAAGATQLIKGYVGAEVKKSKSTTNAVGNVYGSEGFVPFASGGAFTNSIIDRPTLFPFAKGTGLMGEAGPEAIVPLTRTANGDLGISAEGMGSGEHTVIINIINNSGEAVEQNQKTGSNGEKEIEIIIGSTVGSLIDRGKFDGSMKGRYGLKVSGV